MARLSIFTFSALKYFLRLPKIKDSYCSIVKSAPLIYDWGKIAPTYIEVTSNYVNTLKFQINTSRDSNRVRRLMFERINQLIQLRT